MDLFKTKTARLKAMVAAAAVLAFGATQATADNGGTSNMPIDASVQNSITVDAATQGIDFGTVVVIKDGTGTPATLDAVMTKAGVVTWPGVNGVANRTAGVGTEWLNQGLARMFPVDQTEQAAGQIDISSAAFFAQVGVIYNGGAGNGVVGTPGDPINVCNGGSTACFHLDDITDNTTAGQIVTDAAGTVTVNVGASLKADNSALGCPQAAAPCGGTNNRNTNGTLAGNGYPDGAYTGTLPISVIY